jgi:hypothetical protein
VRAVYSSSNAARDRWGMEKSLSPAPVRPSKVRLFVERQSRDGAFEALCGAFRDAV